jgi:metal-responsive CopG/Arc/MetJ family transcriptional regulator
MKTAISLPDELFKLAEKTADKLGIPRSQLFAKALEEFIQHYKNEFITEKLNEIYSLAKIENDPIVDEIQKKSISRGVKNGSW